MSLRLRRLSSVQGVVGGGGSGEVVVLVVMFMCCRCAVMSEGQNCSPEYK